MPPAPAQHKVVDKRDRGKLPPGEFSHELQSEIFDSRKATKLLDIVANGLSLRKACEVMRNSPSRKAVQNCALRYPRLSKALDPTGGPAPGERGQGTFPLAIPDLSERGGSHGDHGDVVSCVGEAGVAKRRTLCRRDRGLPVRR